MKPPEAGVGVDRDRDAAHAAVEHGARGSPGRSWTSLLRADRLAGEELEAGHGAGHVGDGVGRRRVGDVVGPDGAVGPVLPVDGAGRQPLAERRWLPWRREFASSARRPRRLRGAGLLDWEPGRLVAVRREERRAPPARSATASSAMRDGGMRRRVGHWKRLRRPPKLRSSTREMTAFSASARNASMPRRSVLRGAPLDLRPDRAELWRFVLGCGQLLELGANRVEVAAVGPAGSEPFGGSTRSLLRLAVGNGGVGLCAP